MNVKEKVGLLGLRPASAGPESHGPAVHSPPSLAAGSSTTLGSGGTKAERQAAALQLWNRWAHDALGPMSAEPTAEELARKSNRVQRLEHECASLAARAQRRLEVSSAIRAQTVLIGAGRETTNVSGGGASAAAAGGGFGTGSMSGSGVVAAAASEAGSTGVVLRPGAFNREMQYAVRERRRAAAYAAVRAEGAAEANSQAAAEAAAAEATASLAPAFKSRAMLDALIAGRGAGATSPLPLGAPSVSSISSPKAAAPRLRPHSALPLRTSSSNAAGGGGGLAASARLRPRSAVPSAAAAASLGRQASMAPSAGGGGGAATAAAAGGAGGPFARANSMAQRAASLAAGGPGSATGGGGSGAAAGLIAVPESDYMALRQEMNTVSERLAATQAALEVQTDTEAQLREAVDLLRARLHSSGLREVDAQRRLAQHSKLEPLFDRLAECFTFSSPEEVVARLEFLEDDKLGTFDQLLRTQEEVTRLQQRLAEAQKSGEMVATRLTTEHLQGSARLQEQNEELRQELESMQNLVHRLTSRQAQLVALQTAVLQLWGKLSDDPQFADAFLSGSPGAPGAGRGSTSGAARRAASSGRTQPGHVSTHGGVPDDSGGSGGPGLQPDDPLSMLHMIEEFVTAKSNKLAIRHFTDIQRLANHVWQQHFRNRADIRGRVVPTFEQISKVADRMAGRVKSVQDQASRSQEAEKVLMKEVRRLQQQKRVLEVALARRDEQFKSVMGVPRRERPASATAELGSILRREATVAVGGMNTTGSGAAGGGTGAGGTGAGAATPPRQASRAMSVLSLSPSGLGRGSNRGDAPLDTSFSITSGLSAVSLRPQHGAQHHARSAASHQLQPQGILQRQQQQQQQHKLARPASAPNSTTGGAPSIASAASRLRHAFQGGGGGAPPLPPSSTSSGPTSNGTLAAVLSPAIALQVPQMVSDLPAGPHWRQHVGSTTVNAAAAQRTAPGRLPAGSLFYTAEHIAVAGAAAEADPASAGYGPGFAGDGLGPGMGAAVGSALPDAGPGAPEAAAPEVPSVRWSAPQRSAIEQAFLTRLERRTRVT